MKIVEIIWEDAYSNDEWHDIEEPDPAICQTLGYLTYEGPDRVSVASTVSVDKDEACCEITIPRPMIREFKVLNIVRAGRLSVSDQQNPSGVAPTPGQQYVAAPGAGQTSQTS